MKTKIVVSKNYLFTLCHCPQNLYSDCLDYYPDYMLYSELNPNLHGKTDHIKDIFKKEINTLHRSNDKNFEHQISKHELKIIDTEIFDILFKRNYVLTCIPCRWGEHGRLLTLLILLWANDGGLSSKL